MHMKRTIFIITSIVISVIGFSENNDPHLKRLVACINDSNFLCAEEELLLVENWTNDTLVLKPIEQGMMFLEHASSSVINKEVLDSMCIFLTKEYERLIMSSYGSGEYEQALEYCKTMSSLIKRVKGEMHEDYATSINDIGVMYFLKGEYPKAIEYYLQAYTIYNFVHDTTSSEYLTCLTNLGIVYYSTEDYDSAERYIIESASTWKNVFGEQHPGYAQALNTLGALYTKRQNYSQAEKYYLKALEIRKNIFGEFHEEIGQCYNNLGTLYLEIGDYLKAEQYCFKAIEIDKQVLGEKNPEYATILHNYGFVCLTIGEYSRAERYYLKALEIRKNLLGENHPDYASSLNDLGTLYQRLGEYATAESYYFQAENLRKKISGENSIAYATTINDIGILYRDYGEYIKAEEFLHRALTIYKAILGDKHSMYIDVLVNIGGLYSEMGDYERAEYYYLKSLELRKEIVGEEHQDIAYTLNEIGILNNKQGEYQKAEKNLLQSLAITRQTLGEKHPRYFSVLNSLGTYYSAIKDYKQAESYFTQSIVGTKEILGENHHTYASRLYNMGLLCYKMKKYTQSSLCLSQCSQIMKKHFLESLDYMSESQRDRYWNTMHPYFKSIPMLAYGSCGMNIAHITQVSYDNELFRKGVLLQSTNIIKQSILESNDSILLSQWDELIAVKQVLAHLQETSPMSVYITEYKNYVDSLEKIITKSSSAYRENIRQWNITWDSVRAELKPNQVAIEYMSAPLNEDSTMYCALLLRDTCSYPIMIPLFEEKQVTQKYNTSSGAFSINTTYAYQHEGKELSALIWNKVQSYLNMDDEVFFSPTGILHQIAIENLPYDETHTMADVYHLVRLSSTRELAMHKKPIRQTSAALYGDIAYQEMDANTMLALSSKYNDGTRSATPSRLVDLSQEFEPTAPLPGTKAEIDSIAPILKKQHIAVKVYAQQEACEESVKALSGQKRNILHISTHGFFRPDNGKNSDPMDRCGLYFAGVDKVLKDGNSALPGNVDDGILTAKEISLLDLRDADLVVLSACETGLGDISGEGVFGLQRAFKMAGARTILMTLWRVHDDATRMLMTAFYRHYGQTHDKRTAFRAAQQEVRATYQDPYYWAGFIMLD